MVEGFLTHDGGDAVDQVPVRDRAVRLHARLGVLVVLAAETHDEMRDALPHKLVFLRVPFAYRGELLDAFLVQLVGFGAQPVGLCMKQRPHV